MDETQAVKDARDRDYHQQMASRCLHEADDFDRKAERLRYDAKVHQARANDPDCEWWSIR